MTSQTADPFDTLGVPARFDLDAADLERAWLSRSARLHPDRAADEAAASDELSRVNDAKRVLEDDERRADALVARLGGPDKSAERSLPDGFLERMLERRMAMERARASGDDERLAEFAAWAARERELFIARVGSMFASSPDDETLRAIRIELNAWRYVERMIEQLDPDYDPGPVPE